MTLFKIPFTKVNLEVDPSRGVRTVVSNRAARQVQQHMDALGEAKLRYLLDNSLGFQAFLTPEQEQEWKEKARTHAWVRDIISEQDLVQMLPKWVLRLVVSYGPSGEAWLKEQAKWLRDTFFPAGEDS